MAAFSSAQSGNWNESATWGKSGSPPVAGVDYPGAAGDTFTINSGHTVTYNVNSDVQLGASTIASGGKLQFATNVAVPSNLQADAMIPMFDLINFTVCATSGDANRASRILSKLLNQEITAEVVAAAVQDGRFNVALPDASAVTIKTYEDALKSIQAVLEAA